MSDLVTSEEIAKWSDAADWVDNCARIETTIKDLESRLAIAVEALKKIAEDKARVEYRHMDQAVYESTGAANIATEALAQLGEKR